MMTGRLAITAITIGLTTLATTAAVGTETVVPATQTPVPQAAISSGRNLEQQASLGHSSQRLGIEQGDSPSAPWSAALHSVSMDVSRVSDENRAHRNDPNVDTEEPFFILSGQVQQIFATVVQSVHRPDFVQMIGNGRIADVPEGGIVDIKYRKWQADRTIVQRDRLVGKFGNDGQVIHGGDRQRQRDRPA